MYRGRLVREDSSPTWSSSSQRGSLAGAQSEEGGSGQEVAGWASVVAEIFEVRNICGAASHAGFEGRRRHVF